PPAGRSRPRPHLDRRPRQADRVWVASPQGGRMLRKLTAVALFALAGAARACDDAGHRHGRSAAYAPHAGVPEQAADVRTATRTKETPAAVKAAPVVKKEQAQPKRKPQGKPLPT